MKNLIFIFIVFSILSCQDDFDSTDLSSEIFSYNTFEEAKNNLEEYSDIGVYADGLSRVVISNSWEGNEGNEGTSGELTSLFSRSQNDPIIDAGTFRVGSLKSVFDTNFKRYMPENYRNGSYELALKLEEDVLGKVNNFSLERESKIIYSKDIYVPEKFENFSVQNSGIYDGTDAFIIDRDNVSIEWNSDAKSKNRVLITINWGCHSTNTTLEDIQKPQNEGPISRAILVEDNGEFTFNSTMFNDIPKDAIITLELMRGFIETFKGSDKISYQIQALSKFQRFLTFKN